MIKMMFCLYRRADLTREEFQRYWLEEHAPRVRTAAARIGMVRYVQSHTVESALGSGAARVRGGAEAFDGVMEGWWESEEAARAAFDRHGPDAGLMLLEDERRFIDLARSVLFVTREHAIF